MRWTTTFYKSFNTGINKQLLAAIAIYSTTAVLGKNIDEVLSEKNKSELTKTL